LIIYYKNYNNCQLFIIFVKIGSGLYFDNTLFQIKIASFEERNDKIKNL